MKISDKKGNFRSVARDEQMTEMYLGLRDPETGKVKKTLSSEWLVEALRDPETGKILRLIPDETETKDDRQN